MQQSEPVLTDPDDIRIWNKIGSTDDDGKKKGWRQDKLSILAVIEDALRTTKHLHSAVLVKMLRKAARDRIGDIGSVAIKILDMRRPADMYPVMEAADIIIDDGNLDVAASLLKQLVSVPDTAFKEYLEGMLDRRSGNMKGAMKHLLRSNAIDQSFIRTYDALMILDPGKGWDVLRNIPLIMSGEKKREVQTDDQDVLELQEIYDGWYNGDKGAARKRLEQSRDYEKGHPEFVLAAARIAADVGEFMTSLGYYDKILKKHPNIESIAVEKADVLTSLGKRNDALALLETVSKEDAGNRNVMECTLKALAHRSTVKEFSEHAEKFLRSEHGDKRGHLFVCSLMSGIGLNSEAEKILKMLIPMFPDDAAIHLADAKNELMLGRDTFAMRAADRAVRISPKEADGYCIRAEIHLTHGRLKNAARDGEHALKCDPSNLGSLSVMRTVRLRSGEYNEALEICRHILILDPANADAAKDMAYALDMLGKRQEAVGEYKNALRLRKDGKILKDILSSLIGSGRAEDAADIAAEFVGKDERDADVWRLKGNAEYGSGRFKDAAASYAKAIETRQHDAGLWHSKGMAEEMAGMYGEAETSYDRAVIIDLDNPDLWLSKAIVQEKLGNLSGAVISLNRVISAAPDNVFALVRKSRILAYAGKPKEAMFFLDLALKVDGSNISILEIKKNIYKRSGMHGNVIEVCRTILNIDKKNIEALTDMAKAYQSLGEHDEALKVLGSVSADMGEVGVLTVKKDSAKLNGNTELEIDACRSILRLEPDNRTVKLELADALIRSGDHSGAMDIYDGMPSKDAEVIVLRGKLKSLMGDDSSAVALYHEAVLEDPDNCETLNELANALCDSGEYEEAVDMVSRAIEISPDTPDGYLTKARILEMTDDPEGALTVLNGALNEVAETGGIHLRMGAIYEKRGDLDDALISYDAAIRSGLDESDIYYKRGRVQEMLGNREAAKKSYSAAGAKDGNNVGALERLGTIQMEDGDLIGAAKNLDAALTADPFDIPALLSRARLYVKEGNAAKAIPIYKTLSNRDGCADEIHDELEALLSRDTVVAEEEEVEAEISEEVCAEIGNTYDLSVKVLECAYETGGAVSDDSMLTRLGIFGEKREAVLNYLGAFESYGTINIRSKDFERMERLSKNVILGEHLDDIDSNPLVGIPAAFMSSTAETIDDAKRVIEYIYEAMTGEYEPKAFSDEVRQAAEEMSEMSGDISTYSIMVRYNVGVYTACTIGKLSKKERKDIAHI